MRIAMAAVAAIAVSIALSIAVVSHVEREWSLYTASSKGATYHLFLDPFPDARSCEADARLVRRGGGLAECRSRYAVSFDGTARDRLLWEFASPAGPFARFCGLPT